MPLKALKLENIEISLHDLEVIQSMKAIESLSLDCEFQAALCVFPPKLKMLQITKSSFTGEFIVIEDIPECLESFECPNFHLKRLTEAGFLILPRLLILGVLSLRNSEGNYEIEILPFDIPTTLLTLKISYMSDLLTLPSLCLESLRSIEQSNCRSLSALPPFPQSLLKLKITRCDKIEILNPK
jgi:hypothetical protein